MENTLAAPILGALAGDVIGSTYEFHNVKRTDFELLPPGSSFTDDSVMTLAVAQALMDSREGTPLSTALVERMRELGAAHPNAGYGGKFAKWLCAESAAPYNSWGNGSAMRVSPAGWFCQSLEAVEFVAAETAKVTHNHPEGIRGAATTAGCILLARNGASNEGIAAYATKCGYSLEFTLDDIRPTYTFDVSCQGSVPQAIKAFLESTGFEDAIRKAVSIGGDSDTIAAIAASIAQGRYGVPLDISTQIRARLTPDLLAANDAFCVAYQVR